MNNAIENYIFEIINGPITNQEYRQNKKLSPEEKRRNLNFLHQKVHIKIPQDKKDKVRQKISNAYSLAYSDDHVSTDETGRLKPIDIKQSTNSLKDKLENIAYYLKHLFLEQGHKKPITQLQIGLNTFIKTSKNKIMQATPQLEITGQLDTATQTLLLNILNIYPAILLKPYIRKGNK